MPRTPSRRELIRRASAGTLALLLAACGPSSPCAAFRMRRVSGSAGPYVGRWRVSHGDTLTLPQMGERFKLAAVTLDSTRVVVGNACRLRGSLAFSAPRAETFAVTWTVTPEQALIYGWPADLGPFGGLGAVVSGGIEVKPGVTAQFVAGRAPPR